MNKTIKNQGFGIIEVIVTLSIIVIIVTIIGQVLASVYRAYQASEHKTEALTYVQEPIEIINGFKNNLFGCSCPVAGAHCDTCTRDGQSCNPKTDYSSCWLENPNLSSWQTVVLALGETALAPGEKKIMTLHPAFSRKIIIKNLKRTPAGELDLAEADPASIIDLNTKKVTAIVYWQERGVEKNVSLSTIFTAWENFDLTLPSP